MSRIWLRKALKEDPRALLRSALPRPVTVMLLSLSWLTGGCVSFESQPVTRDVARANTIYADMASLSYHLEDDVQPVSDQGDASSSLSGWHRVDLSGKPTVRPASDHPVTGLAYDIWRNDESPNRFVIAYRGSEGVKDWIMSNLIVPISPSYKQAHREYCDFITEMRRQCSCKLDVTVVGHSLGGGLALSISARESVPAIVFNPSPRMFDGFGTTPNAAPRTMIYQRREFLEKVRFFWRQKLSSAILEGNRYRLEVDKGHSHRHDILAGNLRWCAENCP